MCVAQTCKRFRRNARLGKRDKRFANRGMTFSNKTPDKKKGKK